MNRSNNIFRILFALALVFALVFVWGCEESVYEFSTPQTDSLKLTSQYEGKSFLNNGIGKVTLTQNVDGDTAHFKDSSGQYFTARFLMINTPESTGKVDPWGKASSEYVANILSNAAEIVCESETVGSPALKDTTNKRYLAYVWYRNSTEEDFRLLNLEIVENCYSRFVDDESAGKYASLFSEADAKGAKSAKRVYGEKDPSYDYSYVINEITIAYLRDHMDEYADNGSKLKMRVRIVRLNGDNIYVEDVEKTSSDITGEYDTAGIYMFSGYGSPFGRIQLGAVIEMTCQCVNNATYGFQLTNPKEVKIIEKATGEDTQIREYDGKTEIDLESLEGLVIKIKKVKVNKVGAHNDDGAYTIYAETESGQAINIRIDGDTTPKYDKSAIKVSSGENIYWYSLIGGVSKYMDTYQVMLCNQQETGVGSADFVLALTDEEIVEVVAENINELINKEIKDSITLLTELDGATISWESDKPEVLSNEGEILKQLEENVEVKLTATITYIK